MNKKTILIVLILVISLVTLSMASFADEGTKGNFSGKNNVSNQSYSRNQGPSGKAFFNIGNRFVSRTDNNFRGMLDMDLTKEQISEIREIMIDFQKESLELRNQIQMKQLEIKELMLEPTLDMERVRAKLEEISKLQVELRMKAIERQTKVKKLLTDEQLENCGMGFPMKMQNFNMGNGNFNQNFQGQGQGPNQGFRGETGYSKRW